MPKIMFIVTCLLVFASCSMQQSSNSRLMYYYKADTLKPYDDVLAELEVAIAEHNFRITGHSRVGKVIRERGAENFPEFDTIQFCNLTHARTLLEISPHLVSYMPCNVVTYQFQGKTIIKTHLLPENSDNQSLNAFAAKMNNKLKQIVDFAAEE